LVCAVVLAVASALPTTSQYRGHKVLRIKPQREKDVSFLKTIEDREVLEAEFWTDIRGVGIPVDIQVSPEHAVPLIAALEDQHIPFSVTHDDLEKAIEENFMQNEKARSKRNSPSEYNFEDYMPYDDLLTWLVSRANDCGDRCELFSIGQTYAGEDMMVIKITDGSGDATKPGLWVDSGIHAREWIAFAMGCWFIDQLVDKDENRNDILNNYDVYILPALNVDGYRYTWTNERMWRKSRMPNDGSSCIGTDLNRNFDHNFGGIGTSTNPCSETYHGGSAYSNVESGNVANYIENNEPAGGWRSFLTLHSYGRLWMAPWGYSTERPPTWPELDRVGLCSVEALTAVHGTSYRYGSASQILYQSSGTSRDWAYGVPQIPYVYTIELRGSSFILPPEQIIPSGEETWAGYRAMVAAIDDPTISCA